MAVAGLCWSGSATLAAQGRPVPAPPAPPAPAVAAPLPPLAPDAPQALPLVPDVPPLPAFPALPSLPPLFLDGDFLHGAFDADQFRMDMDDFRFEIDRFREDVEDSVKDALRDFKPGLDGLEQWAMQAPKPVPAPAPPAPRVMIAPSFRGPASTLYDSAHELINAGRYERAIGQLDRLIQQYDGKPDAIQNRVDAAMYWKAYAQLKESSLKEAMATLEALQQKFADSRWLKDARALAVEVQQASGQRVSPEAQNDEELKLLALRGLMQADPDRAVPMTEQILSGNSSLRIKENALFVLSQSRDPRARTIISSVARSGNPDLQLRAVRYLGAMRTPESRQALSDAYRGTSDAAVKRAILQAYMTSESVDQLTDAARNEKDPQLRRTAIRYLGSMVRRNNTADVLKSLYTAESDLQIKNEIVGALADAQNAAALVDLARAEKNPEAKRNIVSRLSRMKSKEATDYLLEILK
jgi:hypothetical protein